MNPSPAEPAKEVDVLTKGDCFPLRQKTLVSALRAYEKHFPGTKRESLRSVKPMLKLSETLMKQRATLVKFRETAGCEDFLETEFFIKNQSSILLDEKQAKPHLPQLL